jgi:HEAT repeat protein
VFQRNTQARLAMEIQAWGMEEQMAHLAQALGKMNYQPADETLRLYIPKSTPLWVPTRAAAIWALGHLHQDASDDEMAGQLLARLRDVNSDEPEDALVRRFSAIALGFMKSENTLLGLERVAASEGVREAPGIASAWAVHRITGRPVPEVPPIIRRDSAWFLIPTYDGASTQEDQ